MTEMEFLNLTVGVLREVLEDIPDEYSIVCEENNDVYPIMNYSTQDDSKLLIFEVGDLND